MTMVHQERKPQAAALQAPQQEEQGPQGQPSAMKGLTFAEGEEQLAPGPMLGGQAQSNDQEKPQEAPAQGAAPEQVEEPKAPETIALGDTLAMTVFYSEGNKPPTFIFTSKVETEGGEHARNANASMAEHLGTVEQWLKKVSKNGADQVIVRGQGSSGAALAQMAGVLYNPYILACEISHAPKPKEQEQEKKQEKQEQQDQQGASEASPASPAQAPPVLGQPKANAPVVPASGQTEQAPAEQQAPEQQAPEQQAAQPEQAAKPEQAAEPEQAPAPVGADGQEVKRDLDPETDGVAVVNVPELDKRPKEEESTGQEQEQQQTQEQEQTEVQGEQQVETEVVQEAEVKPTVDPQVGLQQRIQAWLQGMLQNAAGWVKGAFDNAMAKVNGALQASIAKVQQMGQQIIARTQALMAQLQQRITIAWQQALHHQRHWLGLGMGRMRLWMGRLRANYVAQMRGRYALMQRQTMARVNQMRAQMMKQMNAARAYVANVRARVKQAVANARRQAAQVRMSLRARYRQGQMWLQRVGQRVRNGGVRTMGAAQRLAGTIRRYVNLSWQRIQSIAVAGAQKLSQIGVFIQTSATSVWSRMRSAIQLGWSWLVQGGQWIVGTLQAGWNWFQSVGSQWWNLMKKVGGGLLGLIKKGVSAIGNVATKAVRAVKKAGRAIKKFGKKIGKRFGNSASTRRAAARRLDA